MLQYLLSIAGIIIGWIIIYYVVKAAVKNGIKEAKSDKAFPIFRDAKPEKPANPEQSKLQQRYDKGEITFEDYQTEWNKLNT